MDLLTVENLSVEYVTPGEPINRAVNKLSFSVPPGRVVGLVGESGGGKSTAVLAVLGLTRRRGRIVSGKVSLEGRELLTLSPHEWQEVRGRQIALVTQNPRGSLNPVARVGKQIVAVYRAHTNATEQQARARALELLKLVGINDPTRRFDAFPDQLSGGMAQRIVIAMALACSPKILIADEPTSGLDVTVRAQILDDLVRSVRTVGSGLVIISRDLSIVANYCDDVYMIHAGEVVERASVERFFAQPHHPATVALLAAELRVGGDDFKLRGLAVDARQLPAGCWLSPRCPFASEAAGCFRVHPSIERINGLHAARCFRTQVVSEAWARWSSLR